MPSGNPVIITIRDNEGNFIEVNSSNPLPTTFGAAGLNTNLHDGAGNPITSTSGELDVSVTESTDSIAIFGNDGSSNHQLLTDSSGILQVSIPSTSALSTSDNKLTVALQELLVQVKIANEYLSLMTDEIITELDISEAIQ